MKQHFHLINVDMADLPGKMDKDYGERCTEDYRLGARLTLNEFIAIIILYVLQYNNYQYMDSYGKTMQMRQMGVKPIPRELWNFGMNYLSGVQRTLSRNAVRSPAVRRSVDGFFIARSVPRLSGNHSASLIGRFSRRSMGMRYVRFIWNLSMKPISTTGISAIISSQLLMSLFDLLPVLHNWIRTILTDPVLECCASTNDIDYLSTLLEDSGALISQINCLPVYLQLRICRAMFGSIEAFCTKRMKFM